MSSPPDPERAASTAELVGVAAPARFRRVLRTLGLVLAAAATFLGSLVLLIYPWLEWWDENYFSRFVPVWTSGYLRGAVTGLGVVNLALSLGSMVRIRRR